MSRKLKRREVLAACTAGVAGLAGCSGILGGGGETSGPGWPLKVGVLAPQTGFLKRFGPEITDSVKLTKKQLEQSEDDFSVDLSIKDTESDPDTAVEAAQSLVDEGYRAIVGPGTSECVLATAEEVFIPESVAACSPLAAASEVIGLKDEGLVSTTAPTASMLGDALARVTALEQVESVSMVHSTDTYGKTVKSETVDQFEVRGRTEVLKEVSIESGQSSYTSKVSEAMADDPGGLVISVNPGEGTQFMKDYYAEAGEKPIYLSDRLRLRNLPEDVSADMSNANVVSIKPAWKRRIDFDGGGNQSQRTTTSNVQQHFVTAFDVAYGRLPTIQAAQAYDATVPLLMSIVAAGQDSYTGQAISGQMENVSNEQLAGGNVGTYSSEDWWPGLQQISEGIKNNYSGATGGVEFARNTGALKSLLLSAARFSEENRFGFEDYYPLQT